MDNEHPAVRTTNRLNPGVEPRGFFRCLKWGALPAVVYLIIAVPCCFAHWYEYSIPMMIWCYASLPARPFLPLGEMLRNTFGWSDTDHIAARLALTAIAAVLYFILGSAAAAILRGLRRQ